MNQNRAHERQRQEVRDEAARIGVRIYEDGPVFKLLGRGIDIRTTDLRHVLPDDLAPINRERTN